jgi:hypothetical protein
VEHSDVVSVRHGGIGLEKVGFCDSEAGPVEHSGWRTVVLEERLSKHVGGVGNNEDKVTDRQLEDVSALGNVDDERRRGGPEHELDGIVEVGVGRRAHLDLGDAWVIVNLYRRQAAQQVLQSIG